MPRPPRAFLPGLPQHLIHRGNNRTAIFAADADYTFYLDCLHAASLQHGVAIHAYVLMTNHLHLLVTPRDADSLPHAMQCLGRRYVRYFNSKYQRTGTLWEGRFKTCLIDTDRYLLACSRYIELNPVRAKMVRHPEEYRWSSYRAHAMGETNPFMTMHAVYLALGVTDEARQAAYRKLQEGQLAEATLQQIRIATNKGWVLGSETLKQAAESHTGRSLWPRPRGRPKKPVGQRF